VFRRFRHKLLFLLLLGIGASGGLALALEPAAWPAVLLATFGSLSVAWACAWAMRRYLKSTVGRLRRAADDVASGRPIPVLPVQPGDDLYKLNAAINVLAEHLADAERQENQLRAELQQRERLAVLGELAASVAHEVNNPLDGVQNCARILRRALNDPQRSREMLDYIDGGLLRIELTVRRLLTLAREHVIKPSEARLAEVVSGAIEVVAAKLDGRPIRITCASQTDDDRALVDRPLLEGVFVNLLLNAADAMPAGGEIELTIQAARDAEADPQAHAARPARLCVEVADRGGGIAPDVLPRIFEPFFSTKGGGRGTGLGLAIAARIVEAHEGSLTVRPREGGGSIFTVQVPAAHAHRARAGAPAARPTAP
jgi:two-component system, NtrC family, sensor kinase